MLVAVLLSLGCFVTSENAQNTNFAVTEF